MCYSVTLQQQIWHWPVPLLHAVGHLESFSESLLIWSLLIRLSISGGVWYDATSSKNDNNLQPSGHYMYHQFNIHPFYVLPTQCIYVFRVDLRTNSYYFTVQHWLVGFYNWDGVCLLRGTFYILRSAHTVYLWVLCGSENKQRLFHCTALTCWF